ncbi:TAP domain-containing protein [Colletotrichum orchidophilum]|uniref:TAP domain-containing protein n=1 Tax=Colletotrichum orchidophilum TaxID=1209926 RepID=A0A1G4B0U9_9PEZI|nr:TAP domain-containing protein [Colletotrichum orchidophilum]OHE94932.1 TAP domain-containing protein [Colletotrichum orchidophilum]
MFPEMINRLVLDGNINPNECYRGHDYGQFADADKALSARFKSCVTNTATSCALARSNKNTRATQSEKMVYTLFDDLNDHPIPFNDTLIDYSMVKTRNLIRFTESWDILKKLGSGSDLEVEAMTAIWCGDKSPRVGSLDDYLPITERQFNESRFLWDRIPAKEQYSGGFNVKTRHPMLFLGNTADLVTPLAAARNVWGDVMTAYFANGTSPRAGTVRELDQPIFH